MTPDIPALSELDSSNSSTSWSGTLGSIEGSSANSNNKKVNKKIDRSAGRAMHVISANNAAVTASLPPPRTAITTTMTASMGKEDRSRHATKKIKHKACHLGNDDGTDGSNTARVGDELDLTKWVSSGSDQTSYSSDDDESSVSLSGGNNKHDDTDKEASVCNRRRPRITAQQHQPYSGGSCDSSILSEEESRRSVIRFAPRNETYGVESHKDFPDKERSKCWYSPKEKERMMQKHERVVARMEQKKPPKGENQTYRGLESWTAEGALQLDNVIALSVNAVMDEQDRQWRADADDADRIASKSREVTADSARRARIVGIEDHQEALALRRIPWTDIPDDASGSGSTVQSGVAGTQGSGSKRKKRVSAKKRERLDEGDKGKSKTRTRSIKPKNGTKTKHNENKSATEGSGVKTDKLSRNDHLAKVFTTPSIQEILAKANQSGEGEQAASTTTTTSDSYTPSPLLVALRERRSARSEAAASSSVTATLTDSSSSSISTSTPLFPSMQQDKRSRKGKSADPPGRRVQKQPSHHCSEQLDTMRRKVETIRTMQQLGRKKGLEMKAAEEMGAAIVSQQLSSSAPPPPAAAAVVVTPSSSPPVMSSPKKDRRGRRLSSSEASHDGGKQSLLKLGMSPQRFLSRKKGEDRHISM